PRVHRDTSPDNRGGHLANAVVVRAGHEPEGRGRVVLEGRRVDARAGRELADLLDLGRRDVGRAALAGDGGQHQRGDGGQARQPAGRHRRGGLVRLDDRLAGRVRVDRRGGGRAVAGRAVAAVLDVAVPG